MASINNERDGSSPGRAAKRLRSVEPIADGGVLATLSPELWAGVLECEWIFAFVCTNFTRVDDLFLRRF